ncbi:MAG TPA: MBL fold metallo-hydrolase [Acidimicrobiales bacterium]|nr:MBL fold metallo-hydrolase [Acidimicrobiales bacterium]
MTLTVTVLGCSGTYAAPGGACTGYLVRGGGVNLLLDCGPGVLGNLQQHLPLRELDAVVVTHEHPDHCTELGVLQNAWRYALGREGLRVLGTAGTLAKIEGLSSDGTVAPTFAWSVVGDGARAELGGLTVTFSRTDHPVETLAVRIDDAEGRSLAFSADTGPAWSFDRLGPGIHLGLCEATFLAEREPEGISHLSARQAGAMSRNAGVERLVITHHWPGDDLDAHRAEAEAAFGGPVEVAELHATYVV